MATSIDLQTRLDGLNLMISEGVRSATISGQTVTYNTTASLIQARDDLQKQINGAAGLRRRKQNYATYAGRGYDA